MRQLWAIKSFCVPQLADAQDRNIQDIINHMDFVASRFDFALSPEVAAVLPSQWPVRALHALVRYMGEKAFILLKRIKSIHMPGQPFEIDFPIGYKRLSLLLRICYHRARRLCSPKKEEEAHPIVRVLPDSVSLQIPVLYGNRLTIGIGSMVLTRQRQGGKSEWVNSSRSRQTNAFFIDSPARSLFYAGSGRCYLGSASQGCFGANRLIR
jgi:hypothetical protein